MDILYNVDEKYLQALDELFYGETPKALHILNQIIDTDPDYARAYYHLGYLQYYHFRNYQSAGYYFKRCIELEPDFPLVYKHYLKLLIVLKMHKLINITAEKALSTPGVNEADIYELLGGYAEKMQDFNAAKAHYKKAILANTSQDDHKDLEEHITRITAKLDAGKKLIYAYQS